MKKMIALVMVMVLLLGVMAGCASKDGKSETPAPAASEENVKDTALNAEGAASEATGSNDWTIAVVPKDATNPWFVRMGEGVDRFAVDTDLDAYWKGPSDSDAALQAQVIRDLISQGVDAICVVPIEPATLEPVLKEAMDAGIVVVAHEGSTLQNMHYDIEAFSNEQYGAFIMDNLAAAMGEEGLYTCMVGYVTNASHNEWTNAAVAHQREKYPNMTLLESDSKVESKDNGETAYQVAKELFKKYPDLKGIMGCSSFDAPGVARAIEELGLVGKAFTAGTGMPTENKSLLEKDLLSAVTLWDPAEAGYAMCELAVKILNGEEIADGMALTAVGYDEIHFSASNDKVLEGKGWIVVDKNNVSDYNF